MLVTLARVISLESSIGKSVFLQAGIAVPTGGLNLRASVLSVRSVPGACRAAGFAEADRVLLNATPVNGLSAPTPDRPEICQVAA